MHVGVDWKSHEENPFWIDNLYSDQKALSRSICERLDEVWRRLNQRRTSVKRRQKHGRDDGTFNVIVLDHWGLLGQISHTWWDHSQARDLLCLKSDTWTHCVWILPLHYSSFKIISATLGTFLYLVLTRILRSIPFNNRAHPPHTLPCITRQRSFGQEVESFSIRCATCCVFAFEIN